jgi:hypothetical protein
MSSKVASLAELERVLPKARAERRTSLIGPHSGVICWRANAQCGFAPSRSHSASHWSAVIGGSGAQALRGQHTDPEGGNRGGVCAESHLLLPRAEIHAKAHNRPAAPKKHDPPGARRKFATGPVLPRSRKFFRRPLLFVREQRRRRWRARSVEAASDGDPGRRPSVNARSAAPAPRGRGRNCLMI